MRKPLPSAVVTYRVETFAAYRRAVRVRAALGVTFAAVCICVPSPLRAVWHDTDSGNSATAGMTGRAFAHVAYLPRRDRFAPSGVAASPASLPELHA